MKFVTVSITFIILFLTQTAFGQTANDNSSVLDTPVDLAVDLMIDMSALSDAVTVRNSEVILDGDIIDTSEITVDGSMDVPVSVGKHILKVFVPSHGADQISFETKPEASGKFAITLTPNLIGLSKHIDDYKLEWVNGSGQSLVPTSGQVALKFTDKTGKLIPITQVMDARLTLQHYPSAVVSVTDLFSITEPGVISVQDKQRFLQLFSNSKPGGAVPNLTLRARDLISGIDYESDTDIRLAPVAVKGRIIRGKTVPENLSLEGVEINVHGVRVKTDAEGQFSVAGVPAGDVSFSARIYDRGTVESGGKYKFTYSANESFDVSGPVEVQLTLERRKRGAKRGVVKLLSHQPTPDIIPKETPLFDGLELTVKPHVRFKLINLISNPSSFLDGDTQKKTEAYCQDAYKRGWNTQGYCAHKIKKHVPQPIDIWTGPEDAATRAGQLHVVNGDVWFVSQDDKITAKISPAYHLSDWGYEGFGYAVAVLDFKDDTVAIDLPNQGGIGWVDITELLGEAYTNTDYFDDSAELKKSNHIGFSHLSSCGWSFAGQQVFVENTDETSFTYRLPTAHDLWSPYDDDSEQPRLGEHESIKAPWHEAYSADRKLLLIPNPGKEC